MTDAVWNWRKFPHGPRVQAKAISYIAEQVDAMDFFSDGMEDAGEAFTMKDIIRDCHKNHTPDVSESTLRRWWNLYDGWGELPHVVKKRKQQIKKKYGTVMLKRAKIDDGELIQLKKILDDHPNLYLDEIALAFHITCGKYLHYTTIWNYITKKIGYSLQSISTSAKQQCKEYQDQFLFALHQQLQGDPTRLITIDETHKDRNASRRRRGWAKRNSGGVKLKEWYTNVVRYTLIAAADIHGFITSACHTVLRDEILEEGAAGTVDADYFLYWVREYLVPVLGRFEYGEPRSVVSMDNASTHMSIEVENEIRKAGAVLIYSPSYSPELNPIENYFALYKAYLKRNEMRMVRDWEEVHMEALQEIDYEKGVHYFKRCGIIN